MAGNPDNDSPLVRCVEAVLDDQHGISTYAYNRVLRLIDESNVVPPRLKRIIDSTDAADDRVFLKEDWADNLTDAERYPDAE